MCSLDLRDGLGATMQRHTGASPLSNSRIGEQNAASTAPAAKPRKAWHTPAFTRYPSGAAGTVRSFGNVDGGGGAHKDS